MKGIVAWVSTVHRIANHQQYQQPTNHSLNTDIYMYTPVFYRFRTICICQFGSATSIARLFATFPNIHSSRFDPQYPTKDPFQIHSCIARIMLIVSGLSFCPPCNCLLLELLQTLVVFIWRSMGGGLFA